MATLLVLLLALLPPQKPEALYERAYREYINHDLESARRDFLSVIRDHPPAFYSCYFMGRIALSEGKAADAVPWLERAASADPPVLDARAQLGKAYLETRQFEKARDATLQALRSADWDGALHYRLARIYQHLGQTELMQQEFAASARLKSADQQAVIQLSQCVQDLAAGRQKEALEIRREFLADPRRDPDALVALGKMFADAGLQAEALEPFLTASRRDPGSFEAQYDLGLALLNLRRAREAQQPLAAAVRLLPPSREANAALALAYVMAEDYGRAVPVLESMPESSRSASLLGLAYLRSGAAAKAVPVLRQAAAASTDPKISFLLVEALNATEDQPGALAAAVDAARRFPALPQAHLAQAQQLARMGQYAAAAPVFEQVLQLAPGHLDARLGWAEALQKTGDYARSLNAYEEVLRQDAANVTAQLGAARDLILLRRFDDARVSLEAAVAAQPRNAPLRLELSRAYARLGDRERAAEQTRVLQELRQAEAAPQ